MACSDTRCLHCTEWQRAAAGYGTSTPRTWSETLRTMRQERQARRVGKARR